MTVLWINLALVFLFSFFSRYFSVPNVDPSPIPIKPNKLMVFIVIACLVMVSGLRNTIGDTYFYMLSYKNTDFTWEYVFKGKDTGFGILQMFLKRFSDDPQLLVFITALLTNVLIVIVLYKYSRLFELSLYVYITSGMYIVSMNGIRQYLAAAIFFTATKFLFEGNWKKYSLTVLFASAFHQSALILIPIYFMVRRKAWTGSTFLFLSLAILFTLGFNQFSSVLFGAIENSSYSEYQNINEGGANILRVIVSAVPVVIAYFGRERLSEIFPKGDYIVNMSLLGLVFMIISTQNWIFARFFIYFGLYNLILISWIIKVFTSRSQTIVYYTILVCYFIYSFYENVISLNLRYGSDFIRI